MSLVERLVHEPVQRTTLLAWLLVALLASRSEESVPAQPHPRLGWPLLVLGFSAQLMGAAAAASFIAQVGIAIGIVGVGLILGRPALPVLLLCFGLVPLPVFLHGIASPQAESFLGTLSRQVLTGLGASIGAAGSLLTAHGRRFELVGTDAGLVTAVCAAQYAWYAGARRARPLGALIVRAAVAAAIGVLLQPALVLVCAASLVVGMPELGRFVLSYGVAIGLGLVAVAGRIGEAKHSSR